MSYRLIELIKDNFCENYIEEFEIDGDTWKVDFKIEEYDIGFSFILVANKIAMEEETSNCEVSIPIENNFSLHRFPNVEIDRLIQEVQKREYIECENCGNYKKSKNIVPNSLGNYCKICNSKNNIND